MSVTENQVNVAALKLLEGGLVALPTETVYGLAADASQPDALARLYTVKGRPTRHPVIVHVASQQAVDDWASVFPHEAMLLIERFWPGPLTVILPKARHVLDAVTGGLPGVGLRMPQHPVALALLQAFACLKKSTDTAIGLAAPSANRFGKISPTRAEHVVQELSRFLDETRDFILDGGSCQVGVESTIVDFSVPHNPPCLLRPGGIGIDSLREILNDRLIVPDTDQTPENSGLAPGTLASHYAPGTPLKIVKTVDLIPFVESFLRKGRTVGVLGLSDALMTQNQALHWIEMPSTPAEYARQLYHQLRELDQLGLDQLLLQAPLRTELWRAIWDRIQRAAFH